MSMASIESARRSTAAAEKAELLQQFYPTRLSWKSVDWVIVGWIAGIHLGCLAAPFYFSWSALGAALVLHWLTASIGICLGYHRYLSHRSFELTRPARFFTMLCGSLSAEGSPYRWAAVHRLHHAQSDRDGDPHSPLAAGGLWAHLTWMFLHHAKKHDEILLRRYAPDLINDKMLRFFDKTFIGWSFLMGAVLYAIGGMPWLVWGLFVRMTLCYHSTWFVNSATHLWGYRNYETRDESRNLWWVAILSYGEGWHNNHHAHPSLARAGHRWWEVDMTFWFIRLLERTGLAYNVNDHIPSYKTTSLAEHRGPIGVESSELTKPVLV